MKKPELYRKIPVELPMMQWTGENYDDIRRWCPKFVRKPVGDVNPDDLKGEGERFFPSGAVTDTDDGFAYFVDSPEGLMRTPLKNWIIKGVLGEFYSCLDSAHSQTYEKVIG